MKYNSLISAEGQVDIFRLAMSAPEGCLVEVGVYRGGSASVLYAVALQQERKLFLYDTFEGIPFQGERDTHEIGDFKDTSFEDIEAAFPLANVVKGVFPASFIPCAPIAFVHADADQYQSTKDIVQTLQPHMAPGGIMLFDDWSLEGCRAALNELLPMGELIGGRPVYRF